MLVGWIVPDVSAGVKQPDCTFGTFSLPKAAIQDKIFCVAKKDKKYSLVLQVGN